MKNYFIPIFSFLLIACSSPTQEVDPHAGHDHSVGDGHDHGAEEAVGEDTHSDEIIFTPTQASLGEFELYTAQPREFHSVIRTAGKKISSPSDGSIVVAPSSGIVLFADNISQGQQISTGVLMNISSKNLADGDSYSKLVEDFTYSKSQWERAQELIKDRIISQKEFDEAKREYRTTELAYNALKGSSQGVAVKAPFSGYIKDVFVENGAYVEKGTPLFSVMKNNRSRLSVDVPQKYFSDMRDVVSATFTSGGNSTVYDTDLLGGKIISYSKSVDKQTNQLNMAIEYNGVDNLPEGAFVEVCLRVNNDKNTIVVPLSSITEEQGYHYVYVRLDEEGYQKRPVTLGQNDNIDTEILSGVKAGDIVVSKGAYRVKMAATSTAIPHGHEH